jgi:RNA polymerase sigma factor (sigma-70 family)
MMPPGFALMPGAVPLAADEPLVMDEDAFRAFYDRTARQAWALLYRHTRDMALADDLLQEAYYRLLRTRTRFQSEDHRVHYLFRIAANLATDARRRRGPERVPLGDDDLDALPSNEPAPAPSNGPTSRARWPPWRRATATSCGWPTPSARATPRSARAWASAGPASRCCSSAPADAWPRSCAARSAPSREGIDDPYDSVLLSA